MTRDTIKEELNGFADTDYFDRIPDDELDEDVRRELQRLDVEDPGDPTMNKALYYSNLRCEKTAAKVQDSLMRLSNSVARLQGFIEGTMAASNARKAVEEEADAS